MCYFKPYTMRLIGFVLMASGWGLVLAALAMLSAPTPRLAFALAGIAVQILGLVLTVRDHLPRKNDKIPRDGRLEAMR